MNLIPQKIYKLHFYVYLRIIVAKQNIRDMILPMSLNKDCVVAIVISFTSELFMQLLDPNFTLLLLYILKTIFKDQICDQEYSIAGNVVQ